MAAARAFLVSALIGPPKILGRAFPSGQFLDAIELAHRAAVAGFDGKLYVVFDDESIREFVIATKSFGAPIANPFT